MKRSVLALLAAVACGSSSDSSLATLSEASGSVQQNRRGGQSSWRGAPPGTRFQRGHAVRTGAAASARVQMLRGGGVLKMGAESLIRFGENTSGPQRIALETGEATIETGDAELVLETPDGPATLGSGAEVRVRRDADGLQFDIIVGTARIEQAGAPTVELGAGDRIALGPSRAAPARAPVPDQPPDAGPPRSRLDAGTQPAPAARLQLDKRAVSIASAPAVVALGLPAGDTAVIHDPGPPSGIRLDVRGRCPGDAVVEVARGRSRNYYRGREQIAVGLGTGRNVYRVLCAEGDALRDAGAKGVLRVLRDAGTRKVRTRAPANTVEADGRKYTLLYQNVKPTITFAWPKAPRASSYILSVTPRRGPASQYRTTKPRHTIDSGKLAEGEYRFRFAVAGDSARGASSPATRLILDFDNAAPVAQLEQSSWDDNSFEVRGLATVGSTVSVRGMELPLDSHYRFKGRIVLEAGERAVAVRIVRPGGAVHYYVRRAPSTR
ncbi:MAG TPA: hypothetical protein VML75_00925 [Kofleriaceae bacterium]|nr:hypothetical protein [Kofleriaceae bacterium]